MTKRGFQINLDAAMILEHCHQQPTNSGTREPHALAMAIENAARCNSIVSSFVLSAISLSASCNASTLEVDFADAFIVTK